MVTSRVWFTAEQKADLGQPTSPRSRRTNSTPSSRGSINGTEKPWTSKRSPIGCTRCCSDQLNPPAHFRRSDCFSDFPKAVVQVRAEQAKAVRQTEDELVIAL